VTYFHVYNEQFVIYAITSQNVLRTRSIARSAVHFCSIRFAPLFPLHGFFTTFHPPFRHNYDRTIMHGYSFNCNLYIMTDRIKLKYTMHSYTFIIICLIVYAFMLHAHCSIVIILSVTYIHVWTNATATDNVTTCVSVENKNILASNYIKKIKIHYTRELKVISTLYIHVAYDLNVGYIRHLRHKCTYI
jgi:hypothetical protein